MPGFAVPPFHSTNQPNGVESIVYALSILNPGTPKFLGPAQYKDLDPVALNGAALAATDHTNGDLFNRV